MKASSLKYYQSTKKTRQKLLKYKRRYISVTKRTQEASEGVDGLTKHNTEI